VFCALSGIWAGRAADSRTAESRFITFLGSAPAVLNSLSARVHSKTAATGLATANNSPSQARTLSGSKPGAHAVRVRISKTTRKVS
jgi:hypothetical protein